MIEDKLILKSGLGHIEYIKSIDANELIRNPKLLKRILDECYLKVNREDREKINNIRFKTGDTGYNTNTSALTAYDHIIQFSTEIIHGDSAKNTNSGFEFIVGLSGVYRISTNITAKIGSIDAAEVSTYIDSLGVIKLSIYVNGTLHEPNTGFTFRIYDILAGNTDLTTYPYAGGEVISYANLNQIIGLNVNDVVTVRAGFTYSNPIAAVAVNIKGDININYESTL
jgi:hypothetical protein